MQRQYFFLDRPARDQAVDEDGFGLADAVGTADGLGFDGGVPPRVIQDSECDASPSYPLRKNVTVLAKLARYDANRFATDTTKVWFSLEARF